ncbi:MAG TPA: hypothetical protein VKT77_09980 [Chthonomonadaceae bacterium]|nr:hypothetical protein [Chthonomonadaceae bacterium]
MDAHLSRAGGGFGLLARQAAGVGIAIALAVVGTLVIGGLLKVTIGLRVSQDEEEIGLDVTQHGEEGCSGTSEGNDSASLHGSIG